MDELDFLSAATCCVSVVDTFQIIIGKRALDQVLAYQLNLLQSEDEANAPPAFLTLSSENARSNIILSVLIPNPISRQVASFNVRSPAPETIMQIPVLLLSIFNSHIDTLFAVAWRDMNFTKNRYIQEFIKEEAEALACSRAARSHPILPWQQNRRRCP